ncbi:MAG TPA: hypothetical protein VHK91_03815 [Flavisolibacter sp.]|jgi:LytS/YehU family sensor histidine kinase|nr:hypothetical protein [Flavisolibacter sp.]
MTEQPWISLKLSLNNNELSMKLINGKPTGRPSISPGIGIVNVRKRLELLYPNKHELSIMDEEEMYVVNLKLTLQAVCSSEKELHHEPAEV